MRQTFVRKRLVQRTDFEKREIREREWQGSEVVSRDFRGQWSGVRSTDLQGDLVPPLAHGEHETQDERWRAKRRVTDTE